MPKTIRRSLAILAGVLALSGAGHAALAQTGAVQTTEPAPRPVIEGGWVLRRLSETQCTTTIARRDTAYGSYFRLRASPKGVALLSNADFDGSGTVIDIDGRRYPVAVSRTSNRLVMQIDRPLLVAMQNGTRIDLGFAPAGPSFPLSGSMDAIDALVACAGTVLPEPVLPEEPPSEVIAATAEVQQPAAAPAAGLTSGSCKLVVDGTTYIDTPVGCPIVVEDDGAFWINTDRTAYQGRYFAALRPDGAGKASAHWNAEAGATHAQALLGEDFTPQADGCWKNARAMICADQP